MRHSARTAVLLIVDVTVLAAAINHIPSLAKRGRSPLVFKKTGTGYQVSRVLDGSAAGELREGEVVVRDALLHHVWGREAYPTTRTIDNFSLILRKRLERDPASPIHITRVSTAGYRFSSGRATPAGPEHSDARPASPPKARPTGARP